MQICSEEISDTIFLHRFAFWRKWKSRHTWENPDGQKLLRVSNLGDMIYIRMYVFFTEGVSDLICELRHRDTFSGSIYTLSAYTFHCWENFVRLEINQSDIWQCLCWKSTSGQYLALPSCSIHNHSYEQTNHEVHLNVYAAALKTFVFIRCFSIYTMSSIYIIHIHKCMYNRFT